MKLFINWLRKMRSIFLQILRMVKRWLVKELKMVKYMWPYYIPILHRPISGKRFFCQNSGGCGSMYIIELYKKNHVANCFHEKNPDLDELGISYYEGTVSKIRLKSLIIHSRKEVFFEASNRLFAMTKILKSSFPDSRFIHLHRDPRELIPSSLSKPYEMSWESGRKRYTSTQLCGPANTTVLERTCNYWANYNQRILDDLKGEDYLSLKFSDLIAGNIDALEEFIGVKLSIRKLPPVNANKPVREAGLYPSFENWNKNDQKILLSICGQTMKSLGYKL